MTRQACGAHVTYFSASSVNEPLRKRVLQQLVISIILALVGKSIFLALAAGHFVTREDSEICHTGS